MHDLHHWRIPTFTNIYAGMLLLLAGANRVETYVSPYVDVVRVLLLKVKSSEEYEVSKPFGVAALTLSQPKHLARVDSLKHI